MWRGWRWVGGEFCGLTSASRVLPLPHSGLLPSVRYSQQYKETLTVVLGHYYRIALHHVTWNFIYGLFKFNDELFLDVAYAPSTTNFICICIFFNLPLPLNYILILPCLHRGSSGYPLTAATSTASSTEPQRLSWKTIESMTCKQISRCLKSMLWLRNAL